MSATARRYRAAMSGPRVRASLFALSAACIIGLALLKATDVEVGPLTILLKVILPFSFVGLSIVDFRASVAIAVFELVLAGASGSWTEYGAHLSGRIFLDGVVMLRAVSIVFADRRRGDRSILGRYGKHALALAILFPAIWMPLGLLRGNGAGNVFGDGNGFAFFALAIVVITLVRHGHGAWFRNLLLAACAANGIANLLLIVASVSHLTTLMSIRNALYVRLDMGGDIGYMSQGAFRLFTGASLFLLVGLALTSGRLLARPRCFRYWFLLAVFWIDLVATYTRGLWIGGAVAFALIVALGAPTLKRALTVAGVTAAGFAIALLVTPAAGFSLSNYVFQRASTIASSVVAENHRASARSIVNPGFEESGGWETSDWGPQTMQVRTVDSEHRSGSHSLELTETAPGQDDYVYQNLSVKPSTRYTASAWVKCVGVTASNAAGSRGVFVWEIQDGLTFNTSISAPSSRWQRIVTSFKTGRLAAEIQIRLYAPLGRVYWDDAKVVLGPRGVDHKKPIKTKKPTAVAPIQTIGPTNINTESGDVSGELSNGYRVEEAKSLLRHARRHPLFGSGFGAIATDFAKGGYRYELSYLDLLYKAGIVGLLLFLSFPLRLIWDALRLRFGRAEKTREKALVSGSVTVAIVASVLLVGATNPYLFAAFGLFPILAAVAWLEPAPEAATESRKN